MSNVMGEKLFEYSRAPDLLNFRLKTVSDEFRVYKPAPDKWSVHEIIVHLADSENQSYLRLRTAISEPGNLAINCDENLWANGLYYLNQNFKESLDLIRLIRKMNLDLLKNIPDEKWNNHIIHSVRGRLTLLDLLNTYIAHIPIHINQIDRNETIWKSKLI